MNNSFTKQIRTLFTSPDEFFKNVQDEDWKPAFKFFLLVTLIISFVTPIVNYFGVESTDFSSAYQAQIIAYQLVKHFLLPQYGIFAYIIEFLLIIIFASAILIVGTLILHVLYGLIAGHVSILNAWKSMCYGTAPVLLGVFLPYIAVFAGFYSMLLQFYLGPKIL